MTRLPYRENVPLASTLHLPLRDVLLDYLSMDPSITRGLQASLVEKYGTSNAMELHAAAALAHLAEIEALLAQSLNPQPPGEGP